jgi:MFS transporter, DHA2 family, multidrug resistance protein
MSVEAEILSGSGRRQATIALITATAMQGFDATIANVALPQLEQSLGGGIDLGSWVMASYLCASAVMATLTGWLRRRYGARQLFAGSIGLFVFASILCAVAPSSAALVQFRLIQGAAAGIIQPLSQAILLDIYPRRDHGRMLAIWGATIMTGPILGPVLGGVITDLSSWRWIFALNVPLGFVAIFGVAQVPAAVERVAKTKLDGVGIVLLVLGIGSLQLTLERSIGQMWPFSAEIIAEGTIAVLALVAIAIRSARSRFSLFRFQVFCDVNFATSVFYNFMVSAVVFTTIVFLPALSEGPLGYDATQAGLAMSPRGIGTMAMMFVVGWLIDRIDHRIFLASGLLITAGALVLISRVPAHDGVIWLASASALQGLGVGLLFTPMSTLAFSTLAPDQRTDAAGVYSLLRQVGCATGVATMTGVLQAKIHVNLADLMSGGTAAAQLSSQAVDHASFAAYIGCFQTMAVITAAIVPGIVLFRVLRPGPAGGRIENNSRSGARL